MLISGHVYKSVLQNITKAKAEDKAVTSQKMKERF